MDADPAFAPLRPLRIGCVGYLNARPLIAPYTGPVRLGHPADLARDLAAGELDVGLIPLFEALRLPGGRAVDGVAIASHGAVWSVFLAYRGPLPAIRKVVLDPASRTSAHLCRVLLAEWEHLEPEYVAEADEAEPGVARLLIGDQAIAFREAQGAAWEYLDLGAAWLERTGLPFVFAVWLLRPEVPEPGAVAGAFREMARRGVAAAAQIAEREEGHPAGFAHRYLTHHIRYTLGAPEREAVARYAALLRKYGWLPPGEGADPLVWV